MKKVLASVVVCMLTICCLFMVGCSPAGTYKFEKIAYNQGGVSVEYKAGDFDYLTEDYAILELKKDGTGTFVMDGEETDITWEKDGKVVKVKIGYTTVDLKIDGKRLILEYSGATITLKK